MSVAFGRLRCFVENRPYINTAVAGSQRSAMYDAQRAFAPHENIPFRYGYDERTGLEYSLAEALEKKKNADVYIIAKRNGNIELRLSKKVVGKDGMTKSYIPSDNLNKNISVEINPNVPIQRLKSEFRRFVKRCEGYLKIGENKFNKEKEAEIKVLLERERIIAKKYE